ncbi:hypothetical protein SFRURICE_015897 [Spodoptera frugiperda]|nr:hypothetical protein SFRURICE_015897 [Spodoptera frugiperda]
MYRRPGKAGVRCQKTSPWCTLGTGDSPPNGGDRVGVAIACSEFLDGAEEPEMGRRRFEDCPRPQIRRRPRRLLKSPRLRGVEAGERPRGCQPLRGPKPAKRPAAEDTPRSGALSDSSIKEVSDADDMEGERGTGTLRQTVREALRQVAGKKSQSTKAAQIKSMEAEIMAAVFDVCKVPSAGKVHQELAEMRQELARLSASNAALETELRSTKAELAASRKPSSTLGGARYAREMAAFQQRFNVLEGRLLRPSLAASSLATSRSYAAVAARSSTSSGQTGCGAQTVARPRAAPPTRTPAPPAVQAQATPAANASSGRKRRRRGAAVQQAEALATGAPTPTARGPDGSEWQVVGEARRVAKEARKRRKKAHAQRQRRQQERKEKRAAALLLAPKTAAVVITLQPDAVKRGMTYGDVLAKLKGAVTPAEFGAPNGFAIKATATGARLLEVPGATSGPSADALAERLRACLGADEVRVSRPTKCLDLRIMGLDDSVTEYKVVAAVARTGGCPADQEIPVICYNALPCPALLCPSSMLLMNLSSYYIFYIIVPGRDDPLVVVIL